MVAAAVGAAATIGGAAISASSASKARKSQENSADQQMQLQWDMYQQQRDDLAPWRSVGNNALNELAMRLGIGGYGGAIGGAASDPASQALGFGSLVAYGADGTPMANPELYASNAAYRKAWDDLLAQHTQWAGRGYRFDSDGSEIENALRQTLAAQQQEYNAQNPVEQNPLYGSLLKRFSDEDFQTDPGYEFRLGEGQKALESSAAARGGLLSGAAAKALTKYNQNFASNEYQNAYNRFTNDQTNIFNRLANIAGVGQTATNQLGQATQNYANQAGDAIQYGGTSRASGYANQANIIGGGLGGLAGIAANANWGGNTPAIGSNPFGGSSSGIDWTGNGNYGSGYSWM